MCRRPIEGLLCVGDLWKFFYLQKTTFKYINERPVEGYIYIGIYKIPIKGLLSIDPLLKKTKGKGP